MQEKEIWFFCVQRLMFLFLSLERSVVNRMFTLTLGYMPCEGSQLTQWPRPTLETLGLLLLSLLCTEVVTFRDAM